MGNECGNCSCNDKSTQKHEFKTDIPKHPNNFNKFKQRRHNFKVTEIEAF